MSRLLDTLRPFYRPPETFGGEPIDRRALRAAVGALAADLRRLFWMRAVMIAIVFAVQIVIGALYFQSPIVLTGIAGALGLTVAGAIKAMRGVSQEMAEVNLLVLLAGELDAAALERIVDTLVTKLTDAKSPKRARGGAARSSG